MWRPPHSVLGRPAVTRQVLFVAPWADQGLGIQAREYAQWAIDARWGVRIWALPCRKSSVPQCSAAEWTLDNVTVVTDALDTRACLLHCQQHGITEVFILEPARQPIFDFAITLRANSIRVWAIPNVEMIRRTDLPMFGKAFDGILCVNQHTVENLQYFKVSLSLLRHWPFQLHDRRDKIAPRDSSAQMRFLVVGGYNADRRKQARKVMLAFARAFRDRADVHLTVLSQGGTDFAQIPQTFRNITVQVGALTYEQVLDEYQRHHVVVMCSRAEGLGLPFYEAGRAGCAVISLNTALFRELIIPGDNGWLIKASVEPVSEGQAAIGNDDAIVHTYTFEPTALALLFSSLTPAAVTAAQAAARTRYETSLANYAEKWLNFPVGQ